MFTYRTVDVIADTPLHKKLSLLQSGNQYKKENKISVKK